MNDPRVFLLVGLALTTAGRAHAPALGQIQGMVTAEAGQPLAGATVTVVGAGLTATSGADGRYTISAVSAGTYQVRAKLIGYAQITQPVTLGADAVATVDFRLPPAAVQLEGVVVVAYGTQERRDLTGSVSTVKAEQIQEVPTSNPMQAIQARVPGVDVVAGGGYRPGTPMNVRIRGANGVILITTHRGEGAGGTHVTYDAQYGAQSALNLVDMMSGPETIRER